MEPRPLGDPGAVDDCAEQLARLGRQAGSLATQVMGSVRDPGFNGVATVGFSLAGAAIAIELRQRARDLAALATAVHDAADDLDDDQRSWDRRAEAERRARELAAEKAERDRRSAATGDYAL
jgi:hypothetical protein